MNFFHLAFTWLSDLYMTKNCVFCWLIIFFQLLNLVDFCLKLLIFLSIDNYIAKVLKATRPLNELLNINLSLLFSILVLILPTYSVPSFLLLFCFLNEKIIWLLYLNLCINCFPLQNYWNACVFFSGTIVLTSKIGWIVPFYLTIQMEQCAVTPLVIAPSNLYLITKDLKRLLIKVQKRLFCIFWIRKRKMKCYKN